MICPIFWPDKRLLKFIAKQRIIIVFLNTAAPEQATMPLAHGVGIVFKPVILKPGNGIVVEIIRRRLPRGLAAQTLPMAGQSVPFDGGAPAAIIHRDDVVRALEFGISHELSGIYNLINDVTETKERFFGKMLEEAGKDPINWVAPGSGPKSLSNQKLKDAGFELGDANAARDSESFL